MRKAPPLKSDSGMTRQRSLAGIIAIFVLTAATIAAPYLVAGPDKKGNKAKAAESSKAAKGLPMDGLSEEVAILHALNRLGFGPRPGDLERVKEMGLQKWIDQQLHPESIDDSALDARLDRFPTLKMSSSKLLDEFPAAARLPRAAKVFPSRNTAKSSSKMRARPCSPCRMTRRSTSRATCRRPTLTACRTSTPTT